jgi:hypothetical protein
MMARAPLGSAPIGGGGKVLLGSALRMFVSPPPLAPHPQWLHRDLRVPFGGMKDSGTGREGGEYSLDFYSELKNVCVMMGAP